MLDRIGDFLSFSGFNNLYWGNLVMLLVGGLLIYLAIKRQYEPLLLIAIGFGVILANLPVTGLLEASTETQPAGLLSYLGLGVHLAIFPPLIFLGIGALTDFTPLIASPRTFFLGVAAQLGIFATLFGALALGFTLKESGSIGIIGGADGPTAIYTSTILAPHLIGPVAIAAYAYMSLVPVIQPPIMRLITNEKERAIVMPEPRQVSRLELIMFPIMATLLVILILPKAAMRTDPFLTGDGPWELRRQARLAVRQGADVVKACASGGGGTDDEEPDIRNMTYEELEAIADEAHALNKPCASHCFTPESQMNAVKAGVDTIEHMVFHTEESLHKIKEANIPMIPTLAHRTDHAIEIRREIGTAEFVLEKMKQIQPNCFETFQKCHELGIHIAMGTDMGYEPGMGTNAYELEIYCDLGMSPMDAILTTTRNAAQAIGIDSSLGTIEAGKLADILVVEGNPLDDIKILQERENIQVVMKEGDVYIDRRPGEARKEIVHAQPDSWRKIDA